MSIRRENGQFTTSDRPFRTRGLDDRYQTTPRIDERFYQGNAKLLATELVRLRAEGTTHFHVYVQNLKSHTFLVFNTATVRMATGTEDKATNKFSTLELDQNSWEKNWTELSKRWSAVYGVQEEMRAFPDLVHNDLTLEQVHEFLGWDGKNPE